MEFDASRLTVRGTNLDKKEGSVGRVRGEKRWTYTRATVLDGLVRARELGKVVAGHFWLDLNGVEDLECTRLPSALPLLSFTT